MQKKLIVFYLIASLFSFSYFVYSDHPPGSNVTFPPDQIERDLALIKKSSYYNFDILFSADEVEAKAGENATVNFTIINEGSFALREFNVGLSGVDYPYEITPQKSEIPVWGEWNNVDGLKRGQINYQMKISVPSNATDVHLVNLTGMENFSWRKFSKSKILILKVVPSVPVEPNVEVSKISAPEMIKEYEPFNVSFSVGNQNPFRQQIDISLDIPLDWSAVENKKSLLLESNKSSDVIFTIVPTNTSGNISIDIVYPFKKQIFLLVKEGPLLTPVVDEPKEEAVVKKPTGIAAILEFIRNLSPIFLAIIVLIAVIVVWFIVKLIKFYTGRKKEET